MEISTLTLEDTSLNGYDHYMMKEINEEPVLVDNLIKKYINNLDKLPDLSKYKNIHIVGCGSAYYAGMIGKNLFEDDGIKVECDVASEYRYRNIIYDKDTLVILISQSGEIIILSLSRILNSPTINSYVSLYTCPLFNIEYQFV